MKAGLESRTYLKCFSGMRSSKVETDSLTEAEEGRLIVNITKRSIMQEEQPRDQDQI